MVNIIPEPTIYFSGWTLMQMGECDSTNDVARNMGSWTAVCAHRQRRGRGRFGRSWQSADGGVWLSAVIPAPTADRSSRLVPLLAGYAVASTLTAYQIPDVRLRWPNDVMVRNKKCGGILVDRFQNDRCVVGIGLNVFNSPEQVAPELIGAVTRMHEWLSDCPEPYEVSVRILVALRKAVQEFEQKGSAFLIEQLAPFWNFGRRIEIERNNRKESGFFRGVDADGRVIVSDASGAEHSFAAEEITLFREVEGTTKG